MIVAAVADEELTSQGIQAVLPTLEIDLAIVTEPTEMEVGVGHLGYSWVEIEVIGLAAHGSRPQLGVDAICKAGVVLTAVERLGRKLAEKPHPLLGPGVIHAGTIRAGTETSTVPERCVLTVERRTLPHETRETVVAEIEALVRECRASDPQLEIEWRVLSYRPGMLTETDAPLARRVAEAAQRIRRVPTTVSGLSYWAESALIAETGVPTVLFGPGGEGAHATVEWVSISDTVDCARVLTEVCVEILGVYEREDEDD